MLNVTQPVDRERCTTVETCISLVLAQIMQHNRWTDGHEPKASPVFHKHRGM